MVAERTRSEAVSDAMRRAGYGVWVAVAALGGWVRRHKKAVLIVWVVACVGGLGGVWLAFQHIPAWYRPQFVPEAEVPRVRRDLMEWVDRISDRIAAGEPFEVTLTAEEVNRLLAVMDRVWPRIGAEWPPSLVGPAVGLDEDGLHLGVEALRGDWRTVVGVHLVGAVSAEGRTLRIRLAGVSGGSFPLPRSVVAPLLDDLVERLEAALREHGSDRSDRAVPADMKDAEALYERGVALPNRFVWPNGERPFRVVSIQTGSGWLKLGIEPLRSR